MRTRKFYLLAATLLLSGTLVNAQLTEKVELTEIYSGEKAPTEEGWKALLLNDQVNSEAAAVTAAVKSEKLEIKGGATDKFSQAAFYRTETALDPTKGYTVEIKAKVTKAKENGAFTLQGLDLSGKGFRIGIYDDAIVENTTTFVPNELKKLTNTDDFHVYRLAVQANGTVRVFRDKEPVGTFKLSGFNYDNLLADGGFENEKNDDFFYSKLDNSTIEVIDGEAYEGEKALRVYNNGVIDANKAADRDVFSTEFPVKPNQAYTVSYVEKQLYPVSTSWRDLDIWLDSYKTDHYARGNVNDADWTQKTVNFKTGTATKKMWLYSPTWDNGGKTEGDHAFDNFAIVENLGLQKGFKLGTPAGTRPTYSIPSYAVNLITEFDPGFEVATPADLPDAADYDANKGNSVTNADGWIFAYGNDGLAATMESLGWYSKVRIQYERKDGDTNAPQIAHTGNYSLRASSLTGGSDGQRLQFRKELEANKTYCFNFWFRNANYGDPCALMFKLANTLAPAGNYADGSDLTEGTDLGHIYINDIKDWTNYQIRFTTTTEQKVFVMTAKQANNADGKGWHHAYLDDLFLYEVPGNVIELSYDPFRGKENLIKNGGFEDVTIDNNGDAYAWALASQSSAPGDDNYPVKYSSDWGAYVRLQDVRKANDTYDTWAHSGSRSLRVSYLNTAGDASKMNNFVAGTGTITYTDTDLDVDNDGMPENQNILFERELEVNKTYTFRFWMRSANYGDSGRIYISNGDEIVWGGSSGRIVDWRQHVVTFTTNEENRTLKFYSEFDNWYNFYLDDLELYEHDNVSPFYGADSFVQFGKSTGKEETEVTIEYVAIDNTGAYAPYAPSTDASLKTLKVNGVAVKDFSADKLTYEMRYRQGWTIPTDITFELNDARATAGTPVLPTSFESGKNVYKVKVTAEDGTTEKEYTITFTQWAVGLDTIDATLYAYVENGTLNVAGAAAGEMIAVYSVAGQLVAQTTDTAIALDAKGTYFVKVAGQVLTVVY